MIPLQTDLEHLLSYVRISGEFPNYYAFEERDMIEPCCIAKHIKQENMTISDMNEYIKASYEKNNTLVLSLYGSFEKYSQKIINYVMYENGRIPLGCIVEEVEKKFYELSNVQFKKPLDELLSDVIDLMKGELPEDFVRPQIFWTDKDYASYFAQYNIEKNQIYVNSILNSISIEEEVIKYLIYHECLHFEFHNHSKKFREKEHKYPEYQRWDNFLYYKSRDYTKDYN